MKKSLIFVMLGIISFLGINHVRADEFYLEYDIQVNEIKNHIDDIGYDNLNNKIVDLINYYNENLSHNYPYYFINMYSNVFQDFRINLTSFSKISYSSISSFDITASRFSYRLPLDDVNQITFEYDYESNSFIDVTTSGYSNPIIFEIKSDTAIYNPYAYYYSNFDFYYMGSLYPNISSDVFAPTDTLYIPLFSDSTKYSVYKANTDFLIEPYYLFDDNASLKNEIYTSINLNDYSYVALSLKDYDTIPESNSSVYTNVYVKGQLCITPVYNYGQTERKDILTGTQVQGCSQYYNDFNLTRMYILRDDVKNHAIYYLKAYDISKDNYVKIDTSKFNITYITEEDKNNPQVNINGKIYPTLSYDSLTDTSTKSEEEGYLPGVSCALGDFNCYTENNADNMFDDLFDKPLEFLKGLWSSITSIFVLITEFLSLLPETMQSFLYLSFMVAIVLGLLKLIL